MCDTVTFPEPEEKVANFLLLTKKVCIMFTFLFQMGLF